LSRWNILRTGRVDSLPMPKCPNARHRTLEQRPSNPETSIGNQHAIADYLDRETTRSDALVEKKQRMKKPL